MKLSELPKLIFKTRDGVSILLLAPELDGMALFFVKAWQTGQIYGARNYYLDMAHPAHAFFASQISLEDYHKQ